MCQNDRQMISLKTGVMDYRACNRGHIVNERAYNRGYITD